MFEKLFERIVVRCLEVGLIRGDKLSVDGTFVEANASKERRIPREQLAETAQVNRTVREYLAELETQNPVEEPTHSQDKVSTTDPGSTYATKGGTPARMGYYNSYLVDNHRLLHVDPDALPNARFFRHLRLHRRREDEIGELSAARSLIQIKDAKRRGSQQI